MKFPEGCAERIRRAMEGEEAQMHLYNVLADEAAAKASETEQQMQQELDKVLVQTATTL